MAIVLRKLWDVIQASAPPPRASRIPRRVFAGPGIRRGHRDRRVGPAGHPWRTDVGAWRRGSAAVRGPAPPPRISWARRDPCDAETAPWTPVPSLAGSPAARTGHQTTPRARRHIPAELPGSARSSRRCAAGGLCSRACVIQCRLPDTFQRCHSSTDPPRPGRERPYATSHRRQGSRGMTDLGCAVEPKSATPRYPPPGWANRSPELARRAEASGRPA